MARVAASADATVESQRQRDQLQAGADQLARDLERTLAAWEGALTGPATPSGTAILEFDSHGVVNRRGVPLPYYPQVPTMSDIPPSLFARGEAAEFQGKQSAADIYKGLTSSRNRQVRAAALVRLARSERSQGNVSDALAAYDALAELGGTPVFGSPGHLGARELPVSAGRKIGTAKAGRDRRHGAAVT